MTATELTQAEKEAQARIEEEVAAFKAFEIAGDEERVLERALEEARRVRVAAGHRLHQAMEVRNRLDLRCD